MNKTKIQLFLLCLLMVMIIYFGFIHKKEPNWQGMPAKTEPIQAEITNPVPFKYKKFFKNENYIVIKSHSKMTVINNKMLATLAPSEIIILYSEKQL